MINTQVEVMVGMRFCTTEDPNSGRKTSCATCRLSPRRTVSTMHRPNSTPKYSGMAYSRARRRENWLAWLGAFKEFLEVFFCALSSWHVCPSLLGNLVKNLRLTDSRYSFSAIP